MKRIITLLFICLMVIPMMSQRTKDSLVKQERYLMQHIKHASIKKPKDLHYSHYTLSKKNINRIKSSMAEKNSLDSLIYNEWDDALNDWEPSRKEQFTYDANEYIDAQIISIWWPSSVWVPIERYEYTFDRNGNLTSVISQSKIMSPSWNNSQKTEYTYDGNGNLILEMEFSWDSMSSIWVNSYKYEYSYNILQKIILELGYEWSTGLNQWINMYKHEYSYDNEVFVASEITYNWNSGNNQWEPYSKWEYSRGNFHLWVPDDIIIYRWETYPAGYWIEETKIEFQYGYGPDAFPILTEEIDYFWDVTNSQWNPYYKDVYQYDSNFNLMTGTYFEWVSNLGEWQGYYKDEFIYDLAYDIEDLIVPYFYESDLSYFNITFHNMVIGYMGYQFDVPNWVNSDKVVFFYKDYNNSLNVHDEILAKSVKIYPNPVNDVLTIYSEMAPIEKVEIFSILGKKVKESTTNFHAIAMDNFATGVYFLRIHSEHGLTTRKLIKK